MHGSTDTAIRTNSSYKKNPFFALGLSNLLSDLLREARQT